MFSQHILDRFRRLGADAHEVQQVETMLGLMAREATTRVPPGVGFTEDSFTLSPPDILGWPGQDRGGVGGRDDGDIGGSVATW